MLYPKPKNTLQALRIALIPVFALLALSCGPQTDTPVTGTVIVRNSSYSPAVDHTHYHGYDATGTQGYDLPPVEKAHEHVLTGLPSSVVLLESLSHTQDHDEYASGAFTVKVTAGSTTLVNKTCRTVYNQARTAVIDENTGFGNLLVRGNFPLDCNSPRAFPFDELSTRLKQIKGTSFNLNEYEIILVSLINNAGNLDDLKAEETIFGLNPDTDIKCQSDYKDGTPGLYECLDAYRALPYSALAPTQQPQKLYWWPLWICGADGCTTLDTYSYSKLQDLPLLMHDLINTAPPYAGGKTKRLVYFNCEHGCDRTGTVHAAYMMFKDKETKTLTLQQAVDLANAAINQEDNCMKDGYLALARKYCAYIYGSESPKCK
jgi:hypothetical protein